MKAVAQLRGVAKAFAGLQVLDGLDLSFPEGMTTAVVGESGSGKTTLLHLIDGVVQPDRGEVLVFGEPVPGALSRGARGVRPSHERALSRGARGVRPSHERALSRGDRGDDPSPKQVRPERFRRRIGYAVQGGGLFPHLTSRQNITLLARLEGWRQEDIAVRYAELLDEMDLPTDVSSRYPHQLSGGQQQRVGLCRALMLKPGLLLLDEPFSAVDPIIRAGIYERFEYVQRHESVSTVLVTHDMREAVRLGDRLVILKDGRVLRSGPTNEVVQEPGDPYVEQLVHQQL